MFVVRGHKCWLRELSCQSTSTEGWSAKLSPGLCFAHSSEAIESHAVFIEM